MLERSRGEGVEDPSKGWSGEWLRWGSVWYETVPVHANTHAEILRWSVPFSVS